MYSRLIYSRGTSRFFFDSGNTSDVGLTHDPSERGSKARANSQLKLANLYSISHNHIRRGKRTGKRRQSTGKRKDGMGGKHLLIAISL